jgi:hypothetical protein
VGKIVLADRSAMPSDIELRAACAGRGWPVEMDATTAAPNEAYPVQITGVDPDVTSSAG